MSQYPCGRKAMSAAAIMSEARSMANELVLRESRGPGDMPNAMRRLEARYGVPAATFFHLRYRNPKRIWADVFLQLSAAYQAERERQLRLLKHDIERTKAIAGPNANSVAAAQALLDAIDDGEE